MLRRRIFLLLLLATGAVVLGLAAAVVSAPDPWYRLHEWASLGRFSRYDTMIGDAARKHGVELHLLRAIVWQESRFSPQKVGSVGERGLMQVGEAAAEDWVRAHKVETFTPTDLFSPRMNLEIGTWYLARALERWKGRDDPIPFALAEYNAGKRRVERWIAQTGETHAGDPTGADALREQIDFPTTRAYIAAILKRRDAYRRAAGLALTGD